MIKISAVSYLNTIPFIYGIKNSLILNQIDLSLDFPALCADKLSSEEVDVGLVPIVSIKNINNAQIISDYCIGSNDRVDTVCLYSDVPISEVKSIGLDYQSRTSVELLKLLLKEYWKISPKLINTKEGFDNDINQRHAALVIGDRAFDLNDKYNYIYDLSVIWKRFTGLPFVFAVWVSNRELSQQFISEFNMALEYGITNINQAIAVEGCSYFDQKRFVDYLNNRICYVLDNNKKKAMELFLSKISS